MVQAQKKAGSHGRMAEAEQNFKVLLALSALDQLDGGATPLTRSEVVSMAGLAATMVKHPPSKRALKQFQSDILQSYDEAASIVRRSPAAAPAYGPRPAPGIDGARKLHL
ncbi:MAG: hypothetical protein M3N08_08640 [Pseudomonadota bacterium]|nr:hypothetical protein [Pseudomonadota bacterium]